ncbi:MAG: sarcosine oxidase subunit delta [Caulobacteraceae bacterium]
MLLIDCPFCGPRDEIEFACGGESHIARPGPAETVSDEAWGAYLFTRANPRGVHFERWVHQAGCRQWFNLARDTLTHEIRGAYPMGAPKPDLAS